MCTTHTLQLSFQYSGGGSSSRSGARTMQGALKSKANDGSEENATCITHTQSLQANITS